MHDVIRELERVGVTGAMPLAALGSAAARYHVHAAAAAANDGRGAHETAAATSVVDAPVSAAPASADTLEIASTQLPAWALPGRAADEWQRGGEEAMTSAAVPVEELAEELGGGPLVPTPRFGARASQAESPSSGSATLDASRDASAKRAAELELLQEEPGATARPGLLEPEASRASAPPWATEKKPEADVRKQLAEERAAQVEAMREAAAHEELVQLASEHGDGLIDGSKQWGVLIANESGVRGLDMPHLKMVILTMMPDSVESYIHVAGRTGRAGGGGRAVSIFTAREQDQAGMITASLRAVKWRVSHDQPVSAGEGADGADDAASSLIQEATSSGRRRRRSLAGARKRGPLYFTSKEVL